MSCEETITWHLTSERLPDSETTVLMSMPGGSEPVWLGWYDGAVWFAVDGGALAEGAVNAWAHVPGGPRREVTP